MILSTCDSIPGKEISEVVDCICASAVVTRSITEPLLSNFKEAISEALKMGPKIVTGATQAGDEEAKQESEEVEQKLEEEGLKELPDFTNLLNKTINVVKERLAKQASKIGADAVINIRISTSVMLLHAFEIIGYGTAVKFK